MNACACLGPKFGEPLCPCQMEGKERSAEYHEYYKPENVEARKKEMNKVFSKIFGWSK